MTFSFNIGRQFMEVGRFFEVSNPAYRAIKKLGRIFMANQPLLVAPIYPYVCVCVVASVLPYRVAYKLIGCDPIKVIFTQYLLSCPKSSIEHKLGLK